MHSKSVGELVGKLRCSRAYKACELFLTWQPNTLVYLDSFSCRRDCSVRDICSPHTQAPKQQASQENPSAVSGHRKRENHITGLNWTVTSESNYWGIVTGLRRQKKSRNWDRVASHSSDAVLKRLPGNTAGNCFRRSLPEKHWLFIQMLKTTYVSFLRSKGGNSVML